ncbi:MULTISPECIES: DALR anticodon-binding domain-containing protein [unclassified Streptomyces]|uniref:DALR anticodon-binding domain-containing protein n=1 Tax=unclassified Streptomyces TaxID=2593676 RepID=UPI002E227652|nr:DALR anticodon-binding domain-containing protein [Streptomyces sp. NBC_01023]
MTPAELSCTVARAVRRAVDEGALSVPVPERVRVERPRPGGRGDYATSAALQLAGPAGMAPRAVAEALRQRIAGTRGIERVEITGPGFLNFTLVPDGSGTVVRTVLAEGARYGTGGRGTEPDHAAAPAGPAPRTPAADHPRLDAARWGALFGGGGDELLARRESNPLFRVQYAHARSRALLRNARDLGFRAAYGTEYDAACERGREAAALVAALADYPAAVESATGPGRTTPTTPATPASFGAGHRIARQLVVVADAFLAFHVAVLPVGDEKPSAAHRSRLALTEAAGTVLAGGLSLLGISAPEHI